MAVTHPYLSHLAIDLHRYEVTSTPESPVVWGAYEEDSVTTTERTWHFQAQGHARLGSCFFRGSFGVVSKSFRVCPDLPFELAWEGVLRQLVSFSRSVLIPQADFEVFSNALLVGTLSARSLLGDEDLDDIRLKIFLNLYVHVYSMTLMYRSHPTFLDKVASQKLEKVSNQLKKLFEDYLHRSSCQELCAQAMVLAHSSFSRL